MKLPDEIREFFREQGKIGAVKRHASLTPERRREIAKQAIETRWAKAKTDSRNSKNATVPKNTRKTKQSGATK